MAELRDQLEKTLGGSYAFERELGGGGMSRVFLAEETALGRKVVVKVLPPDLAATVNVERFRREIQLAAQLQHPHIVPLLSAGIADGLPYYTMPFIEGDSLRTRIIRQGELPIQDALRILRDMASALEYAHDHGVVHRDIKPENVMLTKHHALIMDFGVAKALSAATNPGNSLTSMGVALGTPAYMSPEQATADPQTDHRADIYALGAVAYEMLTGRQLFGDRSPQAMLRAHAIEKPDPIETRRPTVSPALGALVMRMLEKSPADRPQTAEDVLRTIDTFVVTPSGMTPTGTIPVEAIRATEQMRVRSPRRSRSLIAAALVGAGILAAGGMVAKGKMSGPELDPSRVIVLPFANRTGDPQYDELGELAADWVIRGLTEADIADVAPIDPVSRDGDSAGVDTDARSRARTVGAGRIVQGEIHLRDQQLEFRVAILDTRDGSRAGNVQPSSSPRANPMAGIDGMRQRTMGAIASLTKKRMSGLALSDVPPSYDAYQEFMRGEEGFSALQFAKAVTHYSRAAELDSTYAAPVVRSVYALINMGQNARADTLSKELLSGPRRLSEYERRYLERAMGWIEGDWQASYRAAQQLKAAAPSSSFAQYVAARSALPVNHIHEAVRELEKLWPNKYPEAAYYRDLATAYHMLGDHSKQERVLRKAREIVPDKSFMLESWARLYAAKGELEEVSRVVQEMRASHNPSAQDGAGAGMQLVAAELDYHGHAAKAREVREGLVSWLGRRPRAEMNSASMGMLSFSLARIGRCPEAQRVADSIYLAQASIPAVGNRGIVAAYCGRQALADSMSIQLSNMGDQYSRGTHLMLQARIAAVQGKKAEAVDLLIDGIARGAVPAAYHNVSEFAILRGFAPYESASSPKN